MKRDKQWEVFSAIKLWLLLLLLLPAVAQAQFTFTTNADNTLTLTGYTDTNAEVVIPDTTNGMIVTKIGDNAFYALTSITNIFIPNTVTNFGGSVFTACANLLAITVDTNNPVYSSTSGVLFNKNATVLIQFPGGKSGNYTVSNGVTSIGNESFAWCTYLTSITIPISVTNIESGAFIYCYGLTNVTIPQPPGSIQYRFHFVNIGTTAFAYCVNLTNFTIPNCVSNLGSGAFLNCFNLSTVILGKGITNLEAFTFDQTSLKEIYFQGNAPGTDPQFTFPNNPTIYYLATVSGWSSQFVGCPTALWRPRALTGDASFGVITNSFGFNINWASGQTVVVEACTNLAPPIWSPISTNTLTNGTSYFSDPQWTNSPARLYRFRSP